LLALLEMMVGGMIKGMRASFPWSERQVTVDERFADLILPSIWGHRWRRARAPKIGAF
jgi:hypothetical protein